MGNTKQWGLVGADLSIARAQAARKTQAFSESPLSPVPLGMAVRAAEVIRMDLGCDFVAICVTNTVA